MALTKTQVVDSVQERIGFSRKKSTELVEQLIEIIKDTIERGDDVLISGFGKFCVKEKRDPQGTKSGHRCGHDAGKTQGGDLQMFVRAP